jgi:hypothetical protein
MNKQKDSAEHIEESPDSIAEYHRGGDNSIKNVMRTIKDEQNRKGVALSGVDDEDVDPIKEPPEPRQKEIKDPPPRKNSR